MKKSKQAKIREFKAIKGWNEHLVEEFAVEMCSCTEAMEYINRKYRRERAKKKQVNAETKVTVQLTSQEKLKVEGQTVTKKKIEE